MSKVKDPMDRKSVVINGVRVFSDEFAWDTCHKIYVVTDQESRDKLEGYGYEFFPIDLLAECWDGSCGLRFISDASLSVNYISQFYEGTVTITT